MALFTIPKQLSHHTNGEKSFTVNADKLGDAINKFASEKNLKDVFYNSDGNLNQFIRFFLDDELVQTQSQEELANISIDEKSTILVQTAFAGG